MSRGKRASASATLPEQAHKRLREAAGIGFIAVAGFMLVALATYFRNDPGWSHIGPGAAVVNACGVIGAWFADIFFVLLGYAA